MLVEQSGVDQTTKEFWIRYLDHTFNASWMSEEDRERKIDLLLDAINAKHDAQYYNRMDVILRDTFEATFGDIGEIGKKVFDIAQNPLIWIIGGGALLLFLARK